MSGGRFDYLQYRFSEIIDDIERILARQGKEKPAEELWFGKEHYEEYPEDKLHETYPEEIQAKFKDGIQAIKIAQIYAQRIDWYLSGDDGDENFLKRLEDDLSKLK
jgi:hypothetical protein